MRRREPLPRRGGSGSRFVRRQSRRASKPDKQRAQRAECQKAGQRPAFSRRARRRCGVRRRGLGPWFYRLDGNRSPQREAAPVSRTGKVGALQNQTSSAHNAPNVRKRAFGPLPRGVHAAAAEFGGGAWASGSTVWTGAAPPQGESAPVSRTGKVGALQNQASSAHNAPNLGKGLGQAPQSASGSRFLPHSALRSTSSPSGPCATCWKPAFSYRRTGPA